MKNRFEPGQDYLRDSGLAALLLLLIIVYWQDGNLLALLGIAILIIALVFPRILRPWAFLWQWFSFFIGNVVSRILLTLIFSLVVLPVALIRGMLGYDPMKRKEWKKGRHSVMITRNHVYTGSDLNNPY